MRHFILTIIIRTSYYIGFVLGWLYRPFAAGVVDGYNLELQKATTEFQKEIAAHLLSMEIQNENDTNSTNI